VFFDQERHYGTYTDALSGKSMTFKSAEMIDLAPWEYRIFRETK
jgi:hypothetical protein